MGTQTSQNLLPLRDLQPHLAYIQSCLLTLICNQDEKCEQGENYS